MVVKASQDTRGFARVLELTAMSAYLGGCNV
jgi:hypothetical protein